MMRAFWHANSMPIDREQYIRETVECGHAVLDEEARGLPVALCRAESDHIAYARSFEGSLHTLQAEARDKSDREGYAMVFKKRGDVMVKCKSCLMTMLNLKSKLEQLTLKLYYNKGMVIIW